MTRLILICGLPGAGKTTTARALEDELGAVRLCPDEWMVDLGGVGGDEVLRGRVEGLQWRLAVSLLRRGVSVILENGFWSRAERGALRLAARELGVGVELRFLDVALSELWCRVALRNNELPYASFSVSEVALVSYAKVFEAPDADELALFDDPEDGGERGYVEGPVRTDG